MVYIVVSAVVILDQIVKAVVNSNIPLRTSVTLVPKFLACTNLHNTGAAWGSFSGYRILLIIITALCVYFLIRLMISLKNDLTIRGRMIISLIIAGSIGNLIDRVFLGYVRDMIEVLFVDFPVFNIADCAITIGAVLLVIDTIFFDQCSIFTQLESYLKRRKKRNEHII